MIITNDYLSNGKYCAFISEQEWGLIKSWPDERGVQPRDLSLGYIDLPHFGKLHVYPVALLKAKMKNDD